MALHKKESIIIISFHEACPTVMAFIKISFNCNTVGSMHGSSRLDFHKIWRELFSPLHALNFGIGGDGTQHVLWRLENGELEHIRPKIVVVWVGTNNHGHTAEQVTGGIKAIVQLVNERQPQARVVVLGLLPRGQHPNPLREKNRRVNELVRAALAGHPRAHFLDADPGFVHSDGTISHHDMYDYLHLSRLGYAPVCRALHSLLLRLLAQDQGQGAPLLEPAP
ncbi:platelet-activating factor acetylhydrolase IB subunit gamma isoform X2 [Rhinopithecus roxellana]|uniref:platelet-activating factor acetylhydrolase IB subunit gamma isoform X2 n=1 Tax=Rhinopithecus roxellana TaxID=61622 RepID=UPI001237A034|nr:platelet-activating factor acetylhydrolase IB subunit gamma isoform X2 [Rhinopithecus roxellana]